MILGIDPSLNGTGLVLLSENLEHIHKKISFSAGGNTEDKLVQIEKSFNKFVEGHTVRLALIEGPAYSAASQQFTLGMVSGVLRLAARRAGARVIVIPPKVLKAGVGGSGSADKAQVAAGAQVHIKTKLPNDYDVTDAAALALLGALSLSVSSSAEHGVTNRKLLEACKELVKNNKAAFKAAGVKE